MGILDTLGSALGSGKGNQQNDVVSTIMNLIGQQKGGLNGLVEQFTSKGLGDVISSWVGTGKNQPINSNQLTNALGSNTIKNIASKLGMDTGTVTSQLSNLLPEVVDKLTPEGKIPEGDIMSKGMDLLGGLFAGK
jgi:uncharacterized protein YidB (DUF937 family)